MKRVFKIVLPLILVILIFPALASAEKILLSEAEMDEIYAAGFYVHFDFSMDVFTPGTTAPTINANLGGMLFSVNGETGQMQVTGTGNSNPQTNVLVGNTGQPVSGPVGGVLSLSGNAQSGLQSLVNVIGAGSSINVGLNVIVVMDSVGVTINSSNFNVGVLGSNFNLTLLR